MQNSSDFLHIKRAVDTFDWLPVAKILGKSRRCRRGRKKEFTPVSLFKALILKSYLRIDDNTLLVNRLHENKFYLQFCGLEKVPSHDILSKFEKNYFHKFQDIFNFIDDLLESNGAFENDDMSFDGTDIVVPMKINQPAHRYHFGAKSNKKKFHGFWLMILASIKHQLPRRYCVGYAREGQINLAKELFNQDRVDNSKDNNIITMDGIFDFQEMHELIILKQHKIPIIGYNKRRSGVDERINLPSTDWHFCVNPVYRNNEFIVEEFKRRTSVERVNSHAKNFSQISLIQNKVKKSHTIKKTTVETIIVFSFILEQFKLLAKIRVKCVQQKLSVDNN